MFLPSLPPPKAAAAAAASGFCFVSDPQIQAGEAGGGELRSTACAYIPADPKKEPHCSDPLAFSCPVCSTHQLLPLDGSQPCTSPPSHDPL